MGCCSFNTSWKEFRVEIRNAALCAWQEKLSGQDFRQLDIFRKTLYEPNSWISSYLESTKIVHGDVCSLWLAVTLMRLAATFCKKYVPDCMYSPFTKVTSALISPTSRHLFGAVSKTYLRWCLPGYSPQPVPNKTEPGTLTLCNF